MSRSLFLLLAFTLVACDSRKPDIAPSAELGIESRLPVRMGVVLTQLRIAATDLEKARGLMGTLKLPEAEGMAFMYENDTQMRFWMKDTPLDLDIAFVDKAGVILEIKTMHAGDTDTTVSSSDRVRFTIEMSAGWFARFGVKAGDKVELQDMRRALAARGFEARRYIP